MCNHQIRKVYRIRLFEANPSSVNTNMSTAMNTISIRPILLQKGIQYLQTRDEIIMKVLSNAVSVETIPREGEVRTISNLNTGDMDEFIIQTPTSLRFFTTVYSRCYLKPRDCFLFFNLPKSSPSPSCNVNLEREVLFCAFSPKPVVSMQVLPFPSG